ncbi:MAG: 30S ribosomal protein S6 [Patescibacteria group bacterium]
MYELFCLVSSKIEEKEVTLLGEKIEEIIKNLEGEVSYTKNLGQKKLAYPIKKEKKSYQLIFYFQLLPQKIKKLEEKLRNFSEILRYQILKIKGTKEIEKGKNNI